MANNTIQNVIVLGKPLPKKNTLGNKGELKG